MTIVAAGRSFWELLGVMVIVLVPTVPVTYFLWTAIAGGRGEEAKEVTSGRSSATPFALLSIVGTIVLVSAVLVTLPVIAVRAAVT
jgi:hypothetical protein